MNRLAALLTAFLALAAAVRADVVVSRAGRAECVIVKETNATPAEARAATDLADTLKLITGATIEIRSGTINRRQPAIIVGSGSNATALFPEFDFSKFGAEEYVMQVKGKHLLLAGGRPRGTIYAVNRFLQEQCGVRWWTPWATNIPHRPDLEIPALDVTNHPAFEYRAPYWFTAFDPVWKAHNCVNDDAGGMPDELGGCIRYKGFAHTFYPLVPPDQYFATHPEWYSLIDGKRTSQNAQLCLTNPKLRDFVVERVKSWLRESPDAAIVSVTQNDCFNPCACPDCKAIDDAEGSHSGTMLAFVNYIAGKIEPEFPKVAVDTFAYQYTRKPPRTIKPRPNVIVRLCSIECNFREPLDHPSNAPFMADLEGWSKICQRLYIWDYVTDFADYILPQPNWFSLGPNLRIFQDHGVRGVFEEGAYAGYGSEMQELRAWVLAQLLWNPRQNDQELIREFLDGYYGKSAAEPISQYLGLMYAASAGFSVRCTTRKNAPYLQFETLSRAERFWQQAEKAAASDPELLARVRMGHLPVRTAWLKYWVNLQKQRAETASEWPLPLSRMAVADEWRDVARGVPGKDWTVVRTMNEGGVSVDQFLAGFATDPPETQSGPAKDR